MLKMIQSVDTPPIHGLPDNMRRPHTLPPGVPLLFKPDGPFVQEIHLFLLDRVIRKIAKKPSLKTLHAYAEDLSTWWAFLDSNGLEWTPMSEESIRDYAYVLQHATSPKTGQGYKSATISRRIGTVIEYYKWATPRGLADCELSSLTSPAFKFSSSDDIHLAHTSTGNKSLVKILHIKKEDPADKVNILTPLQTKRILNKLGPDLHKLNAIRAKSIRDRLVSEWSLMTGIRLMEVTSLEVDQIEKLIRDASLNRSAKLFKLRITKTKGDKSRTILVPAYLLTATDHYIRTERLKAIKMAKNKNTKFIEPAEIFVNGLDANVAYVGRKLTGKVASSHFRAAVMGCGYIEKCHTTLGTKVSAAYHFHDLRHTFAVRMYTILESLGRREPWKTVQTLLGHKNLTTTIRTYLKHVRVDEVLIGDAISRHIEMLANSIM